MNKYIMLCTMQSVGTWWSIDVLRRHPEIGGIVNPINFMFLKNGWKLQAGWKGNPHNEAFAQAPKTTMIYCHYGGVESDAVTPFKKSRPETDYEWMMLVVPTLSPLRDPLICMIRAWHREPSLYPHNHMINSWVHIARRGGTLGVKYWCMEPFDKNGFVNAIKGVGLSCPDNWMKTLDANKRINSTPGKCPLREDYRNRNIAAIEKKLPVPWRRLKENQPVLRPFLEARGFRKLLWWD